MRNSKKNFLYSMSCILLLASLAWSQTGQPPISTTQLILPVFETNIAPATQANAARVGNPGPQTIYYWMVTNFTLGSSSPVGPFSVINAPNTLSSGNYVVFTPSYPAGIASIDLLKTSRPTPPSGACNCAVATGVTSGTISDQSNSTSSYTVNPLNVSNYTMTVDNEVQGAGSSHAILRQNGVFVADLSAPGGGTLTGSGTANLLSEWTGASSLGNSPITDNTGTYPSLTDVSNTYGLRFAFGSFGSSPPAFPLANNEAFNVTHHLTSDATCGGGTSDCYGFAILTYNYLTAGQIGTRDASLFLSFSNQSTTETLAPIVDGLYVLANNGTSDGAITSFQGINGAEVIAGHSTASAATSPFQNGISSSSIASGTLTRNSAFYGQSQNQGSASAVTTTDATYYVASPSFRASFGSMTHHYGIYLADQTVGGAQNPDPWGIYEAGIAPNQLGGPLTLAGLATGCLTNTSGLISSTGAACGSGSFTSPMTTLGDLIYENATPAAARLAGPTSGNSSYTLTSTPSGGVAQTPSWGLAGVPVDTESAASFTIQSDTQTTPDRAKLVLTTNNTTSTAVTVPQAGSAGFGSNFPFVHANAGSVVATDTPTTSTVNGNATLKLVGQVAGHNPESALWWNDGANWFAAEILPTDANGLIGTEGLPTIPSFNGGTGLSSPAAHSLIVTEGASAYNLVTSSAVNGFYSCGFNVTASAAVDPTCGLSGIGVVANSGNYLLNTSTDRSSYQKVSGGTTATLTLPQATGNGASNYPFITQNLNSGNETITANAADKIDNSATGGSATLLPNFAAFVYQDSSSAPGNWWTLKVPTLAAFSGASSFIGTSAVTPNIYAADTGAVNAYVVTLAPAMAAYTTGVTGCFKATNANTSTTPTVNFNGLGAKTIVKVGGIALGNAGDIGTTEPSCVIYDGANFELINPQQVTGTGAMVLASSPSFVNHISLGGVLEWSSTAPTIASGFGATSPSISINNGTAGFTINVGTGSITNPGVLTFPAAAHDWVVHCDDSTTVSTTNFITQCKGTSTTSVTCTSYTDVATVGAGWTASDLLKCQATGE
jgi:hypothetical protein